MAIQNKLVEDESIGKFLEAAGSLNKALNTLTMAPLSEGDIDEAVLYTDSSKILEIVKKRIVETFTEPGESKLTESQTIADLTEAWTTIKLLKSTHVGISSRDKLLGITDD